MNLEDILKEFKVNKPKDIPERPPHRWGNKFYWWRRFSIHKPLHKYVPIQQKIENGDFDYSPYWKQSEYELYWMCEDILKVREENLRNESTKEKEDYIIKMTHRRIQRLKQDAMKDEFERIESFKKDLKQFYGGNKEIIDDYFNNFEGTLEECTLRYPIYLKEYKQKQINNKFENWGI